MARESSWELGRSCAGVVVGYVAACARCAGDGYQVTVSCAHERQMWGAGLHRRVHMGEGRRDGPAWAHDAVTVGRYLDVVQRGHPWPHTGARGHWAAAQAVLYAPLRLRAAVPAQARLLRRRFRFQGGALAKNFFV